MRKSFTQKVFTAMLIAIYLFGLIPLSPANLARARVDEAIGSPREKEALSRLRSQQKVLSVSGQDLDSKKLKSQSIKSLRQAHGTNDTVKRSYVPGEVLVKFKNQKINLQQFSGVEKARLFADSKNLEKKEDIKKSNISVLKAKVDEPVEEIISRLKNDSEVEYAQPNFQYYPLLIDTNDTYKDLLWGLDNTGQNGGTADADIDAPEAWTISEGGENEVIVAVIDTGVAYNHPDLLANMWDGSNCLNEDGASLDNCNHGYDYEDGDLTPLPTNSSHGTHIAGTIGAVKNNEKGIIGVAPNVKIMAVKSGLTTVDNVNGINFAGHNGAKVINASWGAGTDNCNDVFDQALYEAIQDFDGLFIAAAGNENANHNGSTYFDMPSDYGHATECWDGLNNVISVAATDQDDNLAFFSDYGAGFVDVGAPGVNIYSTVSPSEEVGLYYSGAYKLIYFSFGFEGINVASSRQSVMQKVLDYYGLETTDSILIVGDDGGSSYESYYTNTLTVLGYTNYNMIAVPSNGNGPTSSTMSGYDLVIWFTGDEWWDNITLTPTDQIELGTFLDDSGNLFITGQDIGWEIGYTDFYTNYLKAEYLSDSSSSEIFYGSGIFSEEIIDLSLTGDGAGNQYWINTIKPLDGASIAFFAGESYEYKSGTSMAAPHVAGLAGLIWGYQPDLTYSEVKDIILATGDDLGSLAGKTVTGKRINAANALYSLLPEITIDRLRACK